MSKIVSDPRLPTVNDEKIRPLTQRLYELFRQYAIAHNKSYMWDTEGTAPPTTGTWSISQMCKNTNPTTAIIGWVCTASGTPGTWSSISGGSGGSGAHNDLSGLQGGTTSQYYHLTLAQFNALGTIAASNVTFTPAGSIAATNVQSAIEELDSETQSSLSSKSDTSTTVTKDSSVGAANMPSGTQSQRPGTPSTGMLRYSSTVAGFEGYNGSTWVTLVTSANVSSGTYNPTVTNSNNVASVDATDLFLWSRAGDIVTTSGKVLITPTTSGVETRFLITLPVSSNLATTDDLTGVMNVRKSSGEQWSGVVAGDSSDKALTRYTPNLTGSHYCYVTFQFIVK